MQKRILKKRKVYKSIDAETLGRSLFKIHTCKKRGKYSPAVKVIAGDIWEMLGGMRAMAQEFVKNPTLEVMEELRFWLLDSDHHWNSLKNICSRSRGRRSLDRLAKEYPQWLLLLPLEDVAERLWWLEEEGDEGI
jgi:hypothetical protein